MELFEALIIILMTTYHIGIVVLWGAAITQDRLIRLWWILETTRQSFTSFPQRPSCGSDSSPEQLFSKTWLSTAPSNQLLLPCEEEQGKRQVGPAAPVSKCFYLEVTHVTTFTTHWAEMFRDHASLQSGREI